MAEETRPKILAVDDEQMNLELLDAYLSRDYDAISVCSGVDPYIEGNYSDT